MMSNPSEQLTQARRLLDTFLTLAASVTPGTVSNYATLQNVTVQLDMVEEANRLRGIFYPEERKNESSPEAELASIQDELKRVLSVRNLTHGCTALSMAAMPLGAVNALYFNLTILLFSPNRLDELCALFNIRPMKHLSLTEAPLPRTFDRRATRQAMRDARRDQPMVIQEEDFASWAKGQPFPDSPAAFSNMMIIGEYCFSLEEDILSLTFSEHRKLYYLLKDQYPAVHQQLYQRNLWFQQLAEDIDIYEAKGQTPREAIQQFIRGLKIGGAIHTGNEYATDFAMEATGGFSYYLDRMGTEISERVRALESDTGKTVQGVIDHLAKKDCVEQAAGDLSEILANPVNDTVLDARPLLHQADLEAIEKKYKPVEDESDETSHDHLAIATLATNGLPHLLLQQLLPTIALTDIHALYELLINFPEESYSVLIRDLNFSQLGQNPFRSQEPLIGLVQYLRGGFFNKRQTDALIHAIINHASKFGIVFAFLYYLVGQPDYLKLFFDKLTPRMLAIYSSMQNRYGGTLLHYTVGYPESLKQVLAHYPSRDRLADVKLTDSQGRTVLHAAAAYPDSLRQVLALYPEDQRLAAIQRKDKRGRTVLHAAAEHPDSLRQVLALYPEVVRLAAVQQKDNHGMTVLHAAGVHPESLRQVLALYPEEERLAAVNDADRRGKVVLHYAVSQVESLRIVLNLYPETAYFDLITQRSSDGKTVLHDAMPHPEAVRFLLSQLPETQRLDAIHAYRYPAKSVLNFPEHHIESVREMLLLLPIQGAIQAIRHYKIPYESLPEELKNDSHLMMAVKYPLFNFVLQYPVHVASVSSGFLIFCCLSLLMPEMPFEQKIVTSACIALGTYASLGLFNPDAHTEAVESSSAVDRTLGP